MNTPQHNLIYLNDVLENINAKIEEETGLRIAVTFEIFDHMNEPKRVRELTIAAQDLNWKRAQQGESVWYKTDYTPSRVILFTNEDEEAAQ